MRRFIYDLAYILGIYTFINLVTGVTIPSVDYFKGFAVLILAQVGYWFFFSKKY